MKLLGTYILLLVFAFSSYAQDATKQLQKDTTNVQRLSFDEQKLATYKSSNTFNYEIRKSEPGILELIIDWFKRMILKVLRFLFDDITPAVGILKWLFEALPYIITIVALYFIIRFFLGIDHKRSSKNAALEQLFKTQDDEELIKSPHLEALIERAVAEENFRLAIRYYYLKVLQILSNHEKIVWKPEKTNADYQQELSEVAFLPQFLHVTHTYDFVWYGQFDMTATAYQEEVNYFNQLIELIHG